MVAQGTNYNPSIQRRIIVVQQDGQTPSVIRGVKEHPLEAIEHLLAVMQSHGDFFIQDGDIVLNKENELIPLTQNRKLHSETPYILANYVCGRNGDNPEEPLSQKFLRCRLLKASGSPKKSLLRRKVHKAS